MKVSRSPQIVKISRSPKIKKVMQAPTNERLQPLNIEFPRHQSLVVFPLLIRSRIWGFKGKAKKSIIRYCH